MQPTGEVAFHHRGGHLVPKGKLQVHSAKVETNAEMVVFSPKVIWIDEAGILWDISRAKMGYELEPIEWPTTIRANYVIAYEVKWGGKFSTPITADNYELAVDILRHSLAAKDKELKSYEIKSVSRPFDPSLETKKGTT